MIKGQTAKERRIVTIFDDIYDLPDCRDYYRAMFDAGFRTAHHAVQGFLQIRGELMTGRGLDQITVVDFASGYGIAAALMRHDISLDDVLNRYQDTWFDHASTHDVICSDKEWFASRRRTGQNDRYVGIDIAGNALKYGCGAGVFDAAYAENLQADEPGQELAADLARTDLIVECGSVAHLLPVALDRMLSGAKGRKPWIITAPIRGNDSAAGFEVMRDHGLKISTLDVPPFRHRRFADTDEQCRAIENATARGHDTERYETQGYFHAQLFLARPEDEC